MDVVDILPFVSLALPFVSLAIDAFIVVEDNPSSKGASVVGDNPFVRDASVVVDNLPFSILKDIPFSVDRDPDSISVAVTLSVG